jgi:hypothetical protein
MDIGYCGVLLYKHFDKIVSLVLVDLILDILLKTLLADPLCATPYLATRTTPVDAGAKLYR